MPRLTVLIFPFLLLLITVTICLLNYIPGTFLTGWDTLHPEFNFPQQFSNIFFGVFRSDQGLGAIAAHSHMAELPRVIFLWLEHFVLPLSFLRYSYIFLCFILGPLGIYFFIRFALLGDLYSAKKQLASSASFLGALVYICNLVVVQQFYVPFEMFTTQYAFLGWIFLTSALYLKRPTAIRLIIFSLIMFLSAPQAYAAVLWYAFFLCFALFIATNALLTRKKQTVIASVMLIITTFAINSFWLLPNLYFLQGNAKDISLAQTNKIFSDEAFLHNKQYGNIIDTALLKNFLFNWTEQISVTNSKDLMSTWKSHLSLPGVTAIGYIVFIISIIGIIFSIIRRRFLALSCLPIFLVSIIMIVNMNPPFEAIFIYLRDTFPLFKEGLRFPFTKFSILLIFTISVFTSISFLELFNLVTNIKKHYLSRFIYISLLALFTCSLLYFAAPMFYGHLIDPRMKVSIPKEYFEFFRYMQKQPTDARIAPLPVQSLWGWDYFNWEDEQKSKKSGSGYQGAGFIWFGVNQPVLSRDFDRWDVNNEQYYKEISGAIYSRDPLKIEALVKKYRIKYLLLDQSIAVVGNKQNALWHYETKEIFKQLKNVTLTRTFGKNLLLYEVDDSLVPSNFVQAPHFITSVGPQITGGFMDLASDKLGDYFYAPTPDYFYPSRNLVDRYDRIPESAITQSSNSALLQLTTIPPDYKFTTSWLDTDIFPGFMKKYNYNLSTEEENLPSLTDHNPFISVSVASDSQKLINRINRVNDCGNITETTNTTIKNLNGFFRFTAQNGASCGFISFPYVKQDFGNLLSLEAKNTQGLPARLCITNKLTRRCNIYTSLDHGNKWKKYIFLVPPEPSGDVGYEIHFNTLSIGNDKSINDIRNVILHSIPYYRLENIYFTKTGKDTPRYTNGVKIINSTQKNPTLYTAKIQQINKNRGLLTLFKSYDNGWHAYITQNKNIFTEFFPFLSGKEIKQHVRINNWANGWIIEPTSKNQTSEIIIIFLPQYLEYAGFVLLGGYLIVFAVIAVKKRIKGSN